MKKYLLILVVSLSFLATSVFAVPLTVGSSDTIQSVLMAHQGKRVTVKLKSGTELTGKVGEVNENIVHLMELSGKEFFDAVTSIKTIETVVIRTK